MTLPKFSKEAFQKSGAKGGRSKSKAKAKAAAVNGKLGGRPKQKKVGEK